MRKYLTEFIGTFFLVATVGLSTISEKAEIVAPLAVGAVLIAFIYAGKDVSGAHYNPAVTLSVWLRGGWKSADVVPYIVAQLFGALSAAWSTVFLHRAQLRHITLPLGEALVAEFLFTFALCFVIHGIANSRARTSNPFDGLAIGAVVLAGAVCVGRISGGIFNPAVALGRAVMGLGLMSDMFVYLPAQGAGAIVAAMIFRRIGVDQK